MIHTKQDNSLRSSVCNGISSCNVSEYLKSVVLCPHLEYIQVAPLLFIFGFNTKDR